MNILPNILDVDKMYIAIYYSLLINLHLYLPFAQSEPQAVGVHDKIIAVNGVRGTPDEIMGGIRDSKDTATWRVLTSQSILILVMIVMIRLQKSMDFCQVYFRNFNCEETSHCHPTVCRLSSSQVWLG